VAAVDDLDFVCEVLRVSGPGARQKLRQAERLRERLDAVNAAYCSRLRSWLQAGAWSRSALRAELDRHSRYARGTSVLHLEQEPVDCLLDGILGLASFHGAATLENRDYVHLEDSPVRVLLDLVDHVPLGETDCFCDLGAGLGRAAILVHWLTGVPVEGIEIQPEYHAFACELAANFGIDQASFQRADVRVADLSRGTVFYLFTPFKGRVLSEVWARLAREARDRSITVCTYGAISLLAAQQPWLRPAAEAPPHEFSLSVWQAG
jgi:hypothetical protein